MEYIIWKDMYLTVNFLEFPKFQAGEILFLLIANGKME